MCMCVFREESFREAVFCIDKQIIAVNNMGFVRLISGII